MLYNILGFGRHLCHAHHNAYLLIGISPHDHTHENTKVISLEVGSCVLTWSLLPKRELLHQQEEGEEEAEELEGRVCEQHLILLLCIANLQWTALPITPSSLNHNPPSISLFSFFYSSPPTPIYILQFYIFTVTHHAHRGNPDQEDLLPTLISTFYIMIGDLPHSADEAFDHCTLLHLSLSSIIISSE